MHTPGPWKVYEGMDAESILQSGWVLVVCRNDAGRIVANVNLNGGPESKSMPCIDNARLIASAPDLLAALEGMIEMHDKLSKKINWGASFLDAESIRLMNDKPIAAQAAIAKAKGA